MFIRLKTRLIARGVMDNQLWRFLERHNAAVIAARDASRSVIKPNGDHIDQVARMIRTYRAAHLTRDTNTNTNTDTNNKG